MKNYFKIQGFLKTLMVIALTSYLFVSCTKYGGTTYGSSNDNGNGSGSGSGSGSGGSGPDPLPPYGGGSGGGGTGGGGTGGGGTGGGGGTVDPNKPQSYLQFFNFTGTNYSYVTFNDSISLYQDGKYAQVYAGNATLKYKIGTGAANDPVNLYGFYFLRPSTYYTSVFYKTPQTSSVETMLQNDQGIIPSNVAAVRFVQLDPYTKTVPITYRMIINSNWLWESNRLYLDHTVDTSLMNYRYCTPGLNNVTFYYRDSGVYNFNYNFDAGKKYTIYSHALGYESSSRGQLPIPYHNVTRHN